MPTSTRLSSGLWKSEPRDAVGWIVDAGGLAVIAHGGRGIEVVTGSHTASDMIQYTDTALEFDLLASRGSDFHSPEESRVDVGKLDQHLSGRLKPVWDALEHRIKWPD